MPHLKGVGQFEVSPDGDCESFRDINSSQVFTRASGAAEWDAAMMDGKLLHAQYEAEWMDNDRLVFWDRFLKQAILWNAATGEAKSLAGIDSPAGFGFAAQGRQAFINQISNKSDIWLLTLEP